jgi:hypothetical protein
MKTPYAKEAVRMIRFYLQERKTGYIDLDNMCDFAEEEQRDYDTVDAVYPRLNDKERQIIKSVFESKAEIKEAVEAAAKEADIGEHETMYLVTYFIRAVAARRGLVKPDKRRRLER